ncbi:TetR/AcrR family transcriptional regulator [Streptomyces sp. NPDC006645]|uniref:TetR/AcrR family transcriptional regulator n=1 Tax=unclassified Streptomyces TaxID=2593676 RepID=UPI00339F1C59
MPPVDYDERRSSVLEAAEELYSAYGVHAVRMDQVRDRAGVSLAALYKLYPSKHHLVADYLRAHGKRLRARLSDHVERAAPPPAGSRERLLAAFDSMRETVDMPGFRGCVFVNAWAELGARTPQEDPLVAEVVREHKTLYRAYLTRLAKDYADPPGIGEQMHILIEGAVVTSALLGPDAARLAHDSARAVLDAADTTGPARTANTVHERS